MSLQPNKLLEEVNKYIFVRQYEKAIDKIENLIQRDSLKNNILLHLRRIELYTRLSKHEELHKIYTKGLSTDSNNQTDIISLTLLELLSETISPSEAASRFQNHILQFGNNPACFYGIGFSMEVMKNAERAIYNYEQCINIDPNWYPAYFGLSQIYYQNNDSKNGDHFFFLFEKTAPYNVYGNFETHRALSKEFTEKEQYEEAMIAITTLSDWWIENKGICPPEIQVHELLSLARIYDYQGNKENASAQRTQAIMLVTQVINEEDISEGVLFFIAKTLEEYSEFELAFKLYKKILKLEGSNPAIVQKIGSQFLSMGENKLAKELFDEAYEYHPDNPEIRFCKLVSDLKISEINVEEYLIDKERMKKLMNDPTDKVELLSLLHNLINKYPKDPDVHGNLGETYLRLGNLERASMHYQKMYEVDQNSNTSALKYASFEMQYGDPDKAKVILEKVKDKTNLDKADLTEIHWLNATYFNRQNDFKQSLQHLRNVLTLDPWSISYLVLEIANLSRLANVDTELLIDDPIIEKLKIGDENQLDWNAFDAKTRQLEKAHALELVYAREKLSFLYSNGEVERLTTLVKAACRFNPNKCTYDFLKLLNTNFDSPNIYWALGILYKETWQLEVSSMWFEQMLNHTEIKNNSKVLAYLELADCYNWLGNDLPKSIEYAKLALEIGEINREQAFTILGHAYLKSGNIRLARRYLEEVQEKQNPEAEYLKGLLQYRNGAIEEAKRIWKPLLTLTSKNFRFYNIKQEIMKFYFDKAPYMKVN